MLATAFTVLFLSAQCLLALANTEIINFSASQDVDVPIPEAATWLTLHPGAPQKRLNVRPAPADTPLHQVFEDPSFPGLAAPCEHELWAVLDLDDARWARHAKFTLRISWPASVRLQPLIHRRLILTCRVPRDRAVLFSQSPAAFAIRLFAPSALMSHRHGHGHGSPAPGPVLSTDRRETGTRRQYARIRLVDTGVRAPAARAAAPPVPFVLLLEPLYFGVLPASTAPLMALLLPVAGAAAIFAQVVHRYLEQVAQRARAEIVNQTGKKAQKDA